MTNKLKIKDFILIALLTALYMVIYMLLMFIITPLGAFGHAISPGICAIFSGTGVRTFSWTAYTTNPSLCLYSIGLKYSNDFFILFSLYQRR